MGQVQFNTVDHSFGNCRTNQIIDPVRANSTNSTVNHGKRFPKYASSSIPPQAAMPMVATI